MFGDVLAIDGATYARMAEVLKLHAHGRAFTLEEAAARAGLVARAPGPSRQSSPGGGGLVAVLPLQGFMSYRSGGLFALLFGGTSTAGLTAEVRRAAADPTVTAIFIPTDSPGGEVGGVEALAGAIADAAKRKPVTAAVETLGASAAYWAISGASEIIAGSDALLGSLGVMSIHDDVSKALAEAGITRTIVVSAKYKAEGAASEPLSAEARAELQRRVDAFDTMMSNRIAAGRGVTVARVRSDFGQGRILLAKDAVRVGLADRIGTVTAALEGLARPTSMHAAVSSAAVELRRRRLAASTSDLDLELLKLRARAAELG